MVDNIGPALGETGNCCADGGPSGRGDITPTPYIDILFVLNCDTVSDESVN